MAMTLEQITHDSEFPNDTSGHINDLGDLLQELSPLNLSVSAKGNVSDGKVKSPSKSKNSSESSKKKSAVETTDNTKSKTKTAKAVLPKSLTITTKPSKDTMDMKISAPLSPDLPGLRRSVVPLKSVSSFSEKSKLQAGLQDKPKTSSVSRSISTPKSNSRPITPRNLDNKTSDAVSSTSKKVPVYQAHREKALRDSMLAAKKKVEDRAKQLAEEREKERLEYEERVNQIMTRKSHIARSTLPTGAGFFSEHMMKLPSAKKEEVITVPEPVVPPKPTIPPEELAAIKKEKQKKARAMDLANSVAAAKTRYDSTPKGKLALAVAQRSALKKAAKITVVRAEFNGDFTSEKESDVVREITPEQQLRIAEEASYASVDAAFARSREVEASGLNEKLTSLIESSESSVTHIRELISTIQLNDDGIDDLDQLLKEALSHLKNVNAFYAKAQKIVEEILVAAAGAEVLSSQIQSSSSVDDAVQLTESTSALAETTHRKTSELRQLVDDVIVGVDCIKAVESSVEKFYLDNEEGDEDDGGSEDVVANFEDDGSIITLEIADTASIEHGGDLAVSILEGRDPSSVLGGSTN